VTRIAAKAMTARFAWVASTSAPTGVCGANPAMAATDMTTPMLASSHFCEQIDREIRPQAIADVREEEVCVVERSARSRRRHGTLQPFNREVLSLKAFPEQMEVLRAMPASARLFQRCTPNFL
jgi:hypothetical protein